MKSQIETIMELADAYADSSFDQGLNQRTLDDVPEQKRKMLVQALEAALNTQTE